MLSAQRAPTAQSCSDLHDKDWKRESWWRARRGSELKLCTTASTRSGAGGAGLRVRLSLSGPGLRGQNGSAGLPAGVWRWMRRRVLRPVLS